jgi:PncC family amidohydrolase
MPASPGLKVIIAHEDAIGGQRVRRDWEAWMEEALEILIGRALKDRKGTLAVAESCTGGLLGHRITEVPGSSEYFLGGVIAYSDRAKQELLSVQRSTLEQWGAVSEEVAKEMASGARRAFQADFALAVTGIAGPTGGGSDKPVGLTWIALSTPTVSRAERHHWLGDRHTNKIHSAEAALHLLLDTLDELG